MLTSKFGVWVSVALAGLAHAHIGPYHPAMYAVNGTDPNKPSLYTGISSNPLFNLKYEEYWMHARYGVLNFPPPPENAIQITPGGTITLELAENAWYTTLSTNSKITPWGDGKDHPEPYSITNIGTDWISPSGCISSPNLHAQNESTAAGTSLAISYESDPHKVTPNNTVVISVLPNTPWKRVATYQIPEGLPPSDGLVHLVWGWAPRHCGQPNEYFFPLLAKVLPGPTPAKTLGIPAAPVYCGLDPSKCVKGPKQMVIVMQAEGNNVAGTEVLDPDGLWAAPGYNKGCGWEGGAQTDIFVDAGSPNALYPVGGTSSNQTSTSSASGTPTATDQVSSTPTSSDLSSSLPAASGAPEPTDPASGTPTSMDPGSSASDTPSASHPAYGPPHHTHTDPGTATLPGSSSTPTTSGTCKSKNGGHNKRMRTRLEKQII